MLWTNYHTHTSFSDGAFSPELYVVHALAKDYPALGFSDHAPVPFHCDWAMQRKNLKEYARQIRRIGRRFEGRISIYCGLEIDYIPGLVSPSDEIFREIEPDYIIGAVHYVDFFKDGTPWCVDGHEREFKEGLDKIFRGNARVAVSRYFELIREMILTTKPDIVAHLDRFKRNNPGEVFYSEKEGWYQEELEKTLRLIAEQGTILEVNTKGLYRYGEKEPYPGKWAIKRAFEFGIPIHLASDAHHPVEITRGFAEAASMLREAGYSTIVTFRDGSWKPFALPSPSIYTLATV